MLLGAASAELGFAFATLSRARRPARRRRPAGGARSAACPDHEGTAPRVLRRCVRSHGVAKTSAVAGWRPAALTAGSRARVRGGPGRPRLDRRWHLVRRSHLEPVARRVGAARVAREHAHAARRRARGNYPRRGCARRAIARRRRRRRGAPRRPGAPRRFRVPPPRNFGATPFNAAFIAQPPRQNGFDVEREQAPRRRGAPRSRPSRCRSRSPATDRARTISGWSSTKRASACPPAHGNAQNGESSQPRARRRYRATAASARSPGEPRICGRGAGRQSGAVRSRTNSMTSSSVRTGHARDHAAWCAGNPDRRAPPTSPHPSAAPLGHLVPWPACWRLTTRFSCGSSFDSRSRALDRARMAPPSTCSDAPAFSRIAAPETACAGRASASVVADLLQDPAVVSRAIFEALAGARLRPVMVTGAHVDGAADAHAPSRPSRRAEGLDAG